MKNTCKRVFICFALTFTPLHVVAQSAKDYYNHGFAHYNKNDYVQAITDYTRAVNLDPSGECGTGLKGAAFHNRGLAHYKKSDLDQAIEDYTAAIELNPTYAKAYASRGLAYSKINNYGQAIADYTTALELNPDDAVTYYDRGLVYYKTKDYDLAITEYNRALELNPHYTEAYNNRELAYKAKNRLQETTARDEKKAAEKSQKNEYNQAAAELNKTITLKRNDASAYNSRGLDYYHKKDYDRAMADFNKALELNPNYSVAYLNRGNAYNARKDHDRAIIDFNKALELTPNNCFAYTNRGEAYNGKKDYDRAIADFNKARELSPNYAVVYYNLGIAYGNKKDYDQAIASYNQAVKLNSSGECRTGVKGAAYYNRGLAYYNKKDYDRAIADYSRALRLNPEYSEAYNRRELAYGAKKQVRGTIADNEKEAAVKNPDEAPLGYNSGIAYFDKGDYPRAIAEFNAVLDLNPDSGSAYLGRGLAYYAQKDYRRARADFNSDLELNPADKNAKQFLKRVYSVVALIWGTACAALIGFAGFLPWRRQPLAALVWTAAVLTGLIFSCYFSSVLLMIAVAAGSACLAIPVFFRASAGPENSAESEPARDEAPQEPPADREAARFDLRVRELLHAGDCDRALAAYASKNLALLTGADKINLFEIHLRLGNYDRARLVAEDIQGSPVLTGNLELYRKLAELCYTHEQPGLAHKFSRGIFEAMKPAMDIRANAGPYYDFARACEQKGDHELAFSIYRLFMEAGRDKYQDVAARYSELKGKAVHASPALLEPAYAQAKALKTGVSVSGTVLDGRYELRGGLGEGAMGVVYEAWDRKDARQVAVKRMHAYLKEYPEEYGRFRKEAEIVGKLKHPNIVGIHGLIEQGGEIYLVFDYVAGKTLAEVLKERKQLPLKECKDIFNGVCDAVHYAHKNNVIHRDLKPANIMLAGAARAMVMDFGLASELREGLTRVTHQTLSGTPVYMAPEQHAGIVKRESDIYAMGVCLYELVTGVRPFDGFDILAQKRSKTYREATALAPFFPVGVDEVISRALEPEPSQRFADALDFWSALKNL